MTAAPSTEPVAGRYGAPLGRPSRGAVEQPGAKLHLARIRIDSGGYDRGGAYWGHGGWLWEAWDDAGEVYLTGRVYAGSEERKAMLRRMEAESQFPAGAGHRWRDLLDRETAKAEIREILGDDVRFYR